MTAAGISLVTERLEDVRADLAEIKGELKSIRRGYVTTQSLDLIIWQLVQRVEKLEARNLWIDRLVGGIIISALLGLIVVQWWITG